MAFGECGRYRFKMYAFVGYGTDGSCLDSSVRSRNFGSLVKPTEFVELNAHPECLHVLWIEDQWLARTVAV